MKFSELFILTLITSNKIMFEISLFIIILYFFKLLDIKDN